MSSPLTNARYASMLPPKVYSNCRGGTHAKRSRSDESPMIASVTSGWRDSVPRSTGIAHLMSSRWPSEPPQPTRTPLPPGFTGGAGGSQSWLANTARRAFRCPKRRASASTVSCKQSACRASCDDRLREIRFAARYAVGFHGCGARKWSLIS